MSRIKNMRKAVKFFTYCHDIGKRFCSSSTKENVRVRFAPSPTGYIHLGGLRTALYNDLFAKSRNGALILRMEDTDQNRKVEGAAEQIVEDLNWCGIHFDEGPYFQSERTELYKKYAKQLVDTGHAYHCFCSPTRLNIVKKESVKAGLVPKYDNKCRNLSKEQVSEKLQNNEPHCIRLKVPDCQVEFEDLIFSKHQGNLAVAEGDPIILKTDGFPTYHLANVVDDHCMNISHVLRGTEWLSSTIKHILLYKAFGWTPPQYGHLPLLLNADGTKFSKRQNDRRIRHFREAGYFPNSLINLIIQAGGGFNISQEERSLRCFSINELIERFDISKIHRHSSKLQFEYLDDLNRMEMKRMLTNEEDTKVLIHELRNNVKSHSFNNKMNHCADNNLDKEYLLKVLNNSGNRIYRVEDLWKEFSFLWVVPQFKVREQTNIKQELVMDLFERLSNLHWVRSSLRTFLQEFARSQNIQFKDLMIILRLILIGEKEGPSIVDIFELLGKENSLSRLKASLEE